MASLWSPEAPGLIFSTPRSKVLFFSRLCVEGCSDGHLPWHASHLPPIPNPRHEALRTVLILCKACHAITSVTQDGPRACGRQGCPASAWPSHLHSRASSARLRVGPAVRGSSERGSPPSPSRCVLQCRLSGITVLWMAPLASHGPPEHALVCDVLGPSS